MLELPQTLAKTNFWAYFPLIIWSWSLRGGRREFWFMNLLRGSKSNYIWFGVLLFSCRLSLLTFVPLCSHSHIYCVFPKEVTWSSLLSSLTLIPMWNKPADSVSLMPGTFFHKYYDYSLHCNWSDKNIILIALIWMFSWQYACPATLLEGGCYL